MIYLILDVHYIELEKITNASVAGIRFTGENPNTILNKYQITVNNVAPYCSGQFYKREMPCLITLVNQIADPFDVIIVDGFVYLDGLVQAGLGKHLYDNLHNKKPIIGVAKNSFHGITEKYEVYRGESKNPLYVTTHDFNLDEAKLLIKNLEGKFRVPSIIQKVDKLSRETCTH